MIIGYRRAASKLPLTDNEDGARGTWLEKRLALLNALRTRGHELAYLSEPTSNSRQAGYAKQQAECDLLIVEFAGTNLSFYGKDWEQTCELISKHKGKVIFLNDDPDLPFLWKMLPNENWSRWIVAANATNIPEVRKALKVPAQAKVIDTPFASLLTPQPAAINDSQHAIYYGRPNGRTKQLATYLATNRVLVAGKPKEWAGFDVGVIEPPQQSERAQWYRNFAACLGIYDNKHQATGWRTGRSYHALYAGVPVVSPRGNKGQLWAKQSDTAKDLLDIIDATPQQRAEIRNQQLAQATLPFPWEKLGL